MGQSRYEYRVFGVLLWSQLDLKQPVVTSTQFVMIRAVQLARAPTSGRKSAIRQRGLSSAVRAAGIEGAVRTVRRRLFEPPLTTASVRGRENALRATSAAG